MKKAKNPIHHSFSFFPQINAPPPFPLSNYSVFPQHPPISDSLPFPNLSPSIPTFPSPFRTRTNLTLHFQEQMQGAVRAFLVHGRNVRRDSFRQLGGVGSMARPFAFPRYESSTSESTPSGGDSNLNNVGRLVREGDNISFSEAKKLMRLVNVEALKSKLGMEGREVISYSELLKACESTGIARSPEQATSFARVLDEAGVVLLFRDKVYLHPDKVVDLLRRSVPLALSDEDDPRREELKELQAKKLELDSLAHKHVRRILWSGLGLGIIQVGLFFRLTYWEFSWDVMEPISFFTTTTGLVVGYAYFLFTRRDPTYQDFMQRLFLSRQRKLLKKHNFDIDRFKELQDKFKLPSSP